jgi:hypothetical protein
MTVPRRENGRSRIGPGQGQWGRWAVSKAVSFSFSLSFDHHVQVLVVVSLAPIALSLSLSLSELAILSLTVAVAVLFSRSESAVVSRVLAPLGGRRGIIRRTVPVFVCVVV